MTMLRYIYYNFVTSVLVLLHTGRADDLSSIGHFHIYIYAAHLVNQDIQGGGTAGSAERAGFEPAKPFRGLHAFQACLFNHSSISPCFRSAKVKQLYNKSKLSPIYFLFYVHFKLLHFFLSKSAVTNFFLSTPFHQTV